VLKSAPVIMAVRQAKAIYDFDAEPGTGEISIHTGEVLTVTRTDVGEGWWEGRRANGECGLFPEAYVEEFTEDVGPPAMAPPPLPQDYSTPSTTYASTPLNTFGTSNPVEDWSADPWSGVSAGVAPTQPTQDWQADVETGVLLGGIPSISGPSNGVKSNLATPSPTGVQDDWDSDFDDESASQVGAHGNGAPPNYSTTTDNSGNLALPAASYQRGSTGDVSGIGRTDSKKGAASSKTSFNRFSMFVKSGSENFILGKVNLNVPELDALTVVDQGDGKYSWLNTKPPFSCVIASPKKEAKFKGLKSYIAYQLTPSFNNIQVSRRYKHFDWLHERLCSKFNFVPIPPLPDKQIQGRYEEEFIEHRMNQLQSFVDRMCRHPVLAQSEVWGHFLSCTDEKRWKSGKRKAEKDPLVGGALYTAISVPDQVLDTEFVDKEVHTFTQFTTQFELAVKNMAKLSADQTTKCQNHYKREFQLIGKSFTQLGQAMEQDGGNYNPGLNNAVVATGECYEEIGRLYEEQPRLDWEHLADMMHDYRGLLSGWPQVLHLHSGSQGKRKEIENDGRVGQTEVNAVKTRTDTVTYALLAEVNTFHEQRVKDIKSSHQHFLQEQIKFYQKITEKLQETLRMYDQC